MSVFLIVVLSVLCVMFFSTVNWCISQAFVFLTALVRFAPRDIFHYFMHRRWRRWNGFGLRIYVGMFGTGKTLSAVEYVRRNAIKYNLNVLSNIHLTDIKYTPLVNYSQIIDSPGNTIVLIDEISTVLNAREWKNFNINLLFQLLQCRKDKKELVGTAQRFAHVDKLIRDITAEVIVCRKRWRVCTNVAYDGWDYENAPAQFAIPPIWRYAYVSTDELYSAFDTNELIDNVKRTDFVSNSEILVNRGSVEVIPEKQTKKGKRLYFGK